MKQKLFTLFSGMLIAASASINLYAGEPPQASQAPQAAKETETAQMVEGSFSKGSWKIHKEGSSAGLLEITVTSGSEIGNYDASRGCTNAPWGSYREYVDGVIVSASGSKNVTRFGKSAFCGMDLKKLYTSASGSSRSTFETVKELGGKCFDQALLPQEFYLPSVTWVGRDAFSGAQCNVLSLPVVETLDENAITPYAGWLMSDRRVTSIQYVDLGSKIKELRPGCLNFDNLWKYDETPSVFISNPTPPNWERLYELRDGEDVGDVLLKIVTFGQEGVDRDYEYPFGNKPGITMTARNDLFYGDVIDRHASEDKCEVNVIVPPALLQTYIDYYKSKKDCKEGYMCKYFTYGDNSKNAAVSSCGMIYAGEPIYNNEHVMIGWWYINHKTGALHIGTTSPEHHLPIYGYNNVPWKSALNNPEIKKAVLHMSDIPAGCFANNTLSGIEVVEVAANGVEIGEEAFKRCTDLERFDTYGPRKDVPLKVGKNAFKGLTNLIQIEPDFVFIGTIGEGAFEGCSKLYITCDSYADTIKAKAFKGCTNLRTSYLELSKVKSIGDSAFAGCSNTGYFRQLKFGSSIKEIGKAAFAGCKGIKDIYVSTKTPPATANNAFDGVDLPYVKLHVSKSNYGLYATHPIYSKMEVDVSEVLPQGSGGDGWTLSADGTLVIYRSFGNMTKCETQPWYPYRKFIKRIHIEEGVTSIDAYEFAFPAMGESNVTSVLIPRSCKRIGYNAFRCNDKLKSIYISSVERISDMAFYGCASLETIELGENLKEAGDYVFQGCVKLERVYDYTTEAAIVGDHFSDEMKTAVTKSPARAPQATHLVDETMPYLYVRDAALNNYLLAKGWSAFRFANEGEHGTIIDSGKFGKGMYILWSDGTLTASSEEGSDITRSGAQTALWKEKLKRVEIIGDLKSLGNGFAQMPNLESVSLSPSIKTLGASFPDCKKLTTINLENVDTVSFKCFENTALTRALMPRAKYIDQNAFEGTKSLEIVTTGEGCSIQRNAFLNSGLHAIDLSTSDLGHADGAFSGCTNLKAVAYNGKELPKQIFAGCTSLKKLHLGSNLEYILARAFEGCTALDTIYIQCPIPPVCPDGTWKENNVDVTYNAFSGLDVKKIRLILPDMYVNQYLKAPIWEDMLWDEDPDYADLTYPIYIPLGTEGKGAAIIYAYSEGKPMSIDYTGPLPASAHEAIYRYMPYNERAIAISDNVTAIEAPETYNKNLSTNATRAEYLEIGANVKSIGSYAFHNDIWSADNFYIDCYAPKPPKLTNKSFNFDLIDEKVGDNGIKEREKMNLYILDEDSVYDAYTHAFYYHYFNIVRALAPKDAPQLVTVTFVDWDESVIATEVVEYNGHCGYPNDPVREGYVFKGWSIPNLSKLREDVTVKAEYYEDSYTVRFLDWDNTVLSTEQVRYGGAATAPADPVRDGYIFTGWGAGWFYIVGDTDFQATYMKEIPEGIEDIQVEKIVNTKFIHDGQMYIRHGDAIYTIQGQRVR